MSVLELVDDLLVLILNVCVGLLHGVLICLLIALSNADGLGSRLRLGILLGLLGVLLGIGLILHVQVLGVWVVERPRR